MKNFLAIICIPLVLSACSGSSTDETSGITNKTVFKTTTFSILTPPDWETIQPADFTSDFPTQTQVAFRSNIKNEIYTTNVNVTMRQLEENTQTPDFAKGMLTNAQKSLLSFEELGNQTITIAYGEDEIEGLLYEFQGKKSTVEPIIKFRQLYIAHNDVGFTVTAAYLPNDDENVVNLANEMLDSFSLK